MSSPEVNLEYNNEKIYDIILLLIAESLAFPQVLKQISIENK